MLAVGIAIFLVLYLTFCDAKTFFEKPNNSEKDEDQDKVDEISE